MKRAIPIVALALLLCSVAFAQGEADKKKAAQASAGSWLALVDGGKYAQSWDEASTFFKGAVTSEKWDQMLQQVRTPLGKAEGRKFDAAQYTTELPNAPKGEYVVITYKTTFASTGPAIEVITPMLDKDGKWRVSGYFVRPVGM